MLPFIETHVSNLSKAIGFDTETLCYTLGMFLCYPLGIIMQMLPHGKIKHLFSFLLGAFLLQFTIGKQWVHHIITVCISYLFFLLLPVKQCKTVVPLFVMTYLTLGHFHRQFVNYLGWDLGFHSELLCSLCCSLCCVFIRHLALASLANPFLYIIHCTLHIIQYTSYTFLITANCK